MFTYGMVGGDTSAFIGSVHRRAIGYDGRAKLTCGVFSNIYEDNINSAKAYFVDSDRVYADFREMAKIESERPDGIDFVVVACPNFLHYPVCMEFINAGISVVCEKPLCITAQEGEEIERKLKESDVSFAVMFTYTGYGAVKMARKIVRSGKLGKIMSFKGEYAQDWVLKCMNRGKEGISSWRFDPDRSGSSLCVADIGTHLNDICSYITGFKTKKVLARTYNAKLKLDVQADVFVETEEGVDGSFWCSQIASGRKNSLKVSIYGEEGAIEWDQENPDLLKYSPVYGADVILRVSGIYEEDFQIDKKFAPLPEGHPHGFHDAFANIYKEFLDELELKKFGKVSGKNPKKTEFDFPGANRGLEGMKFIKAVTESAGRGSVWVDL